MALSKVFQLSTFNPKAPRADMFSAQRFTGTQEQAVEKLQNILDTGEAVMGQVLAEDGFVLENLVPHAPK